jgi:hypothetical protein
VNGFRLEDWKRERIDFAEESDSIVGGDVSFNRLRGVFEG